MSNELKIITESAADIEQRLINRTEELSGVSVDPAGMARVVLAVVASELAAGYEEINFRANQNIPSRAIGESLDELSELYGVERPSETAAAATQRFYIPEEAAPDYDITIPQGTRVTTLNGDIYFETTETATIRQGEIYADVTVRCMQTGTVGNGYAAGQLNTIVDAYPFYSTTANLDMTAGGSALADDATLRELFKNARSAPSTAGSRRGYERIAKSVSNDIGDVLVVGNPRIQAEISLPIADGVGILVCEDLDPDSIHIQDMEVDVDYTVDYTDSVLTIEQIPGGESFADVISLSIERLAPCRVRIYALMKDGTAAGSAVRSLIQDACRADDLRPVADKVEADAPQAHPYNIDLTYYILTGCRESLSTVSGAVNAAVEEYKSWQSAKLGRAINPTKLISLIMATGYIARVDTAAPTYSVLRDGSDGRAPEYAQLSTAQVSFGGYEDG